MANLTPVNYIFGEPNKARSKGEKLDMINIGSREKTTDFSESGPFGKKSLTLSEVYLFILLLTMIQ